MPVYSNTGIQISGQDVSFVTKEYLLDSYPSLVDNMRTAGLYTWGNNNQGQLGDNSITIRSSPVQTIAAASNWKQIFAKGRATAAIKTDGTLWLWGRNLEGILGDNTRIHRSSPVQTVSGGTNWELIGGAYYHMAAIKTDGTLWTWGDNTFGGLGDNTTLRRSSPVQTVSGGTNWKFATGGYYHTVTLKTDNSLWIWGYNASGQLGTNNTTNRSSPVQTVSAGNNWKQVAAGFDHTAAIKQDGTLWTWGRNTTGQLGDNSTTDKSSPVQTITASTNWRQVTCGDRYTAAIKTDGTLWIWGENVDGQLGDNTRTNRSSPIQTVSAGTNWKVIDGGGNTTAAIKNDGTLWLWGSNIVGQLGDNTLTHRSSPVQVVGGGTNWKNIARGGGHLAAIRDDSSDPFRSDTL